MAGGQADTQVQISALLRDIGVSPGKSLASLSVRFPIWETGTPQAPSPRITVRMTQVRSCLTRAQSKA